MKLALIMEATYNSGGMERMLAVTANEMTKYYQVTVISAFNEGGMSSSVLIRVLEERILDSSGQAVLLSK